MEVRQEMRCYFSGKGLVFEEEVPQEIVKDYRKRIRELALGTVMRSRPSIGFINKMRANKLAKPQLDIPAEANLEELLTEVYKQKKELVEGFIGNYKYGTDKGWRTHKAFIKNLYEELRKRANGNDYIFELVLYKG